MKKSSFLSGFNLSLAEFHAVPAPVGKAYAASEDIIQAKKETPRRRGGFRRHREGGGHTSGIIADLRNLGFVFLPVTYRSRIMSVR
jgi:hypothetical protein